MGFCHLQQKRVTTDIAGNHSLSRTLTTLKCMPAWTSFSRMGIRTREKPLDLDSNSGSSLGGNFFHQHHSATHPYFCLLAFLWLSKISLNKRSLNNQKWLTRGLWRGLNMQGSLESALHKSVITAPLTCPFITCGIC